MLEKDPKKRITPKEALQHKFFIDNGCYKQNQLNIMRAKNK
jgi:hypothetical protein